MTGEFAAQVRRNGLEGNRSRDEREIATDLMVLLGDRHEGSPKISLLVLAHMLLDELVERSNAATEFAPVMLRAK